MAANNIPAGGNMGGSGNDLALYWKMYLMSRTPQKVVVSPDLKNIKVGGKDVPGIDLSNGLQQDELTKLGIKWKENPVDALINKGMQVAGSETDDSITPEEIKKYGEAISQWAQHKYGSLFATQPEKALFRAALDYAAATGFSNKKVDLPKFSDGSPVLLAIGSLVVTQIQFNKKLETIGKQEIDTGYHGSRKISDLSPKSRNNLVVYFLVQEEARKQLGARLTDADLKIAIELDGWEATPADIDRVKSSPEMRAKAVQVLAQNSRLNESEFNAAVASLYDNFIFADTTPEGRLLKNEIGQDIEKKEAASQKKKKTGKKDEPLVKADKGPEAPAVSNRLLFSQKIPSVTLTSSDGSPALFSLNGKVITQNMLNELLDENGSRQIETLFHGPKRISELPMKKRQNFLLTSMVESEALKQMAAKITDAEIAQVIGDDGFEATPERISKIKEDPDGKMKIMKHKLQSGILSEDDLENQMSALYQSFQFAATAEGQQLKEVAGRTMEATVKMARTKTEKAQKGPDTTPVLFVMGQRKVTQKDFNDIYDRLEDRKIQTAFFGEMSLTEMPEKAVDIQLVENLIQEEAMNRLGSKLTDDEIKIAYEAETGWAATPPIIQDIKANPEWRARIVSGKISDNSITLKAFNDELEAVYKEFQFVQTTEGNYLKSLVGSEIDKKIELVKGAKTKTKPVALPLAPAPVTVTNAPVLAKAETAPAQSTILVAPGASAGPMSPVLTAPSGAANVPSGNALSQFSAPLDWDGNAIGDTLKPFALFKALLANNQDKGFNQNEAISMVNVFAYYADATAGGKRAPAGFEKFEEEINMLKAPDSEIWKGKTNYQALLSAYNEK